MILDNSGRLFTNVVSCVWFTCLLAAMATPKVYRLKKVDAT